MTRKNKSEQDLELGEKWKDQAKLPIIKIYVNISCGLNPGTEQERNLPGFVVTKVHVKNRVIEKIFRKSVVIFILGESVNAVQCNSDLCALNYTELYIIALPSMLSQQIDT